MRDAPRKRHEEQDHGEQTDQAEDALHGQHRGALDGPPRQANRVVEAPGIESHGARRDDAEVPADEVAPREEAEAELDPLPAQQDLPAQHIGEDAGELDRHRGEEPGQEDAQPQAADLGPQLARLRGHELESLQAEVDLGRRLGEAYRHEAAARGGREDGHQAALPAVPERSEAARRAVGGAHEHGALGGGQADVVQGDGYPRRGERRAVQLRAQPADQAREVGVGRLEGPGDGEVCGPDRRVAAAVLDEDGREDPERDGELEQQSESLLHAGKLAPFAGSIRVSYRTVFDADKTASAAAPPRARSMAPVRGS